MEHHECPSGLQHFQGIALQGAPSKSHEIYWVSRFFYSSERKPATHIERVFQLNPLFSSPPSSSPDYTKHTISWNRNNSTMMTMLEAKDLT
mmetsp:Transcript_35608/g.50496  ORF Transcript_35608/g.50496 Transcript_35608/m.50496 type:complete len:91 (-) Transcript_35608:201-473(-)